MQEICKEDLTLVGTPYIRPHPTFGLKTATMPTIT
jgi:hypothetical protein